MGEPHGLAMPNSLRSVANPRERGEPQAGACKNSPTAAELVLMFFSGSRPPNAEILGFGAAGELGNLSYLFNVLTFKFFFAIKIPVKVIAVICTLFKFL